MISKTKKATRGQTKEHNKRLVFKTIYDQGQISRADIARQTQLTRTTVSQLVGEAIAEGLVEEVGQQSSRGGKPATLLAVVDDSRHLIAIDLANKAFHGAVTDLRGKIIHSESVPVKDRSKSATLNLVYQLVETLISEATSPILGIGIGTPGVIDARKGVIHKAINLDWQDLPLRKLLETRFSLPTYIANDSHIAALGEYTFGCNKKTSNLVVVKVGRGTSAGIVLGGSLLYGDGSGAGEIGHLFAVTDGERCTCGNYGCLETVASSSAILSKARAIAQNNPESLLNQIAEKPMAISMETVSQAVQAGERDILEIVNNVGRYLGIAIANLVGTINIQQIIIAGSAARFGEALLEPIRQEVQQHALPMLAQNTRICSSSLGQNIVILGAAALILSQELGIV